MLRLRVFLVLVWMAAVGLPVLALVRVAAHRPEAWMVWGEAGRILPLLRNSVLLAAGTVLLTLVAGIPLGFILYRCDTPGRVTLRRVLIVAMFIPLPLLASAWKATLFALGLEAQAGTAAGWMAWNQGLAGAVLIHSAAGLPWIVWLAGQGFCSAPRTAEEDALVNGGPWEALRRVTWPQARPAIAMAALWVALQTTTEIAVTDLMQVRTFAEEVYAQFSRPDPDDIGVDLATARALAVAIPPALATALLATWLLWSRGRKLAHMGASSEQRPLVKLRRLRWPTSLMMLATLAALLGIPILSLVWKTGAVPPAGSWNGRVAVEQLGRAWEVQSDRIAVSLLWAALTGIGVGLLAWLTVWSTRAYRRPQVAWLFGLVLLWCLPGPVLGMGLKESINLLVDIEQGVSGGSVTVLKSLLYTGPSSAPVMWAAALRYIPCAMALLWPLARRTPRDLEELARTDGASFGQELRHVAWPAMAAAIGRAALVVMALALGELSAGKLVQTPGAQSFASEIFNQMHFGLNNHLAAMCLILLGIISLGGWLVSLARWPGQRLKRGALLDGDLTPSRPLRR